MKEAKKLNYIHNIIYITEIINGLGLLSKFQMKIQKYDKYNINQAEATMF